MSSPPPTSPPPMVWPPMSPASFALPWGQTGCCPPGGMDALLQCYCDVQAATAFICSVMVQCVQNNPAVVEAIVAAIEKSGSSLPLIGVTNGVAAQPGQVGEWVSMSGSLAFTTANQTQSLSLGVLQPGDWDVELAVYWTGDPSDVAVSLTPQPPGFSSGVGINWPSGGGWAGVQAVSSVAQALISVPTLIAYQVLTNTGTAGGAAGNMYMTFTARRAR